MAKTDSALAAEHSAGIFTAAMSNLPVELIMSILEYAYYTREGFRDTDYRTLSACALISSVWLAPAQRLLFRSVSLSTHDPLQSKSTFAFYEILESSSQRGKALGNYVQELEITSVGKVRALQSPWNLPHVLSFCPNLYSLTIRTAGVYELSPEVMADLYRVTAASPGLRIRALNLLQFDVQSPLLYQLLSVWRSIRFLRIGSEIAATPPATHLNLDLYELVLHRTPSPQILEALLPASDSPALRILEFRDLPGFGTRPILARLGRHLRSLRFMRYDTNAAAILRLFPHIEELAVFHVPTVIRLSALPESIEHFSFRNPSHSFSYSLLPIVVAIEPLPRLRVVTCDPGVLTHQDYPALRQACDAKNVELRFDPSPFWIHEDPVVARRFPRRRSVSNFVLMRGAE